MHTTVGVLSAMLLAGVAICGAQEPEMTRPNGTPVVHMWAAGMPDSTKPAMGFPEPEGVRTTLLYHASRDSGIYSHHPQITYCTACSTPCGATTSTARTAPVSASTIGVAQAPRTGNPSRRSPFAGQHARQRHVGHRPYGAEVGRRGGQALRGSRVAREHRLPPPRQTGVLNPVRTAEFPWRSRRSVGIVACEVKEDGTFGPIFAAGTRVPPPERIKYRFLAMDDRRVAPLVSALQEALYTPTGMPRGTSMRR